MDCKKLYKYSIFSMKLEQYSFIEQLICKKAGTSPVLSNQAKLIYYDISKSTNQTPFLEKDT